MAPIDLLEYPASPPTQLSTTTSPSIMLSYSVSKIGRSQNSQDVQHLKFPPISSPVELKSQAFNFFSDSVEPYVLTQPFTEISPFLTLTVPVSSGSALQETLGVGSTLRQAFRTATNFSDQRQPSEISTPNRSSRCFLLLLCNSSLLS
jgi:hypothetical protein